MVLCSVSIPVPISLFHLPVGLYLSRTFWICLVCVSTAQARNKLLSPVSQRKNTGTEKSEGTPRSLHGKPAACARTCTLLSLGLSHPPGEQPWASGDRAVTSTRPCAPPARPLHLPARKSSSRTEPPSLTAGTDPRVHGETSTPETWGSFSLEEMIASADYMVPTDTQGPEGAPRLPQRPGPRGACVFEILLWGFVFVFFPP